MRFGGKDGRVDRSGEGERARLNGRFSEGEETSVDPEPYRRPQRRPRTSREVDPSRSRLGFLLSFAELLDSGDYTQEELAKIFRVSRPTVYRALDELNQRYTDGASDWFYSHVDWLDTDPDFDPDDEFGVVEDGESFPRFELSRSTRQPDATRVRLGFLLAFGRLHKSGDYTPEELAKIFRISRSTVYRTIDELSKPVGDVLADLTGIDRDGRMV